MNVGGTWAYCPTLLWIIVFSGDVAGSAPYHPSMTGCRLALHQHRTIALAIVLLALLARMLIPIGYMPVAQNDGIVMALCPDQGAMPMAHTAMAGMDHAQAMTGHATDHDPSGHMKSGPCAFAGLALTATAAADPSLLALAILFVVTMLFRRPQPTRASDPLFLRPPRTGPPLHA